jgi:caa(3)-type oxidase subunit IV
MHAPEAHGDAPDVHELDHHLKDYKKIIVVLTIATAVEFGIAYLMGTHVIGLFAGILLLVGIAFFKAVLVAKFFMHLRYDPKPLAFISITPLILATPFNVICIFDAVQGPSIGM